MTFLSSFHNAQRSARHIIAHLLDRERFSSKTIQMFYLFIYLVAL